jgi:hypothetical protein
VAVNELIAQGIQPIGRDLPQIYDMLHQRSRQKQADAREAQQTATYQQQIDLQNQRLQRADEAATEEKAQAKRIEAAQWLDGAYKYLTQPGMSPEQFDALSAQVIAHGKQSGKFDALSPGLSQQLPDRVTREQLEGFAINAGLVPQTQEKAPGALSVQNVGGFRVLMQDGKMLSSQAPERPQTASPERAPGGYRWTPDGQLVAITGGPADPRRPGASNGAGNPNLQEGERKAAALGVRLEGALRLLGNLEMQAPGSTKPGVVEKAAGMFGETAANFVRGQRRQSANAAQRDALDAALTLATGAAYTREQLEGLQTSYFPQIGDTQQTVREKQQRFATIVETARLNAGRAAPNIDQALGPRPRSPQIQIMQNETGNDGWGVEEIR